MQHSFLYIFNEHGNTITKSKGNAEEIKLWPNETVANP